MKNSKWTKFKERAGLFYITEVIAFSCLYLTGFRVYDQDWYVQIVFWTIHGGATLALMVGLTMEHREYMRQLDENIKELRK